MLVGRWSVLVFGFGFRYVVALSWFDQYKRNSVGRRARAGLTELALNGLWIDFLLDRKGSLF